MLVFGFSLLQFFKIWDFCIALHIAWDRVFCEKLFVSGLERIKCIGQPTLLGVYVQTT